MTVLLTSTFSAYYVPGIALNVYHESSYILLPIPLLQHTKFNLPQITQLISKWQCCDSTPKLRFKILCTPPTLSLFPHPPYPITKILMNPKYIYHIILKEKKYAEHVVKKVKNFKP